MQKPRKKTSLLTAQKIIIKNKIDEKNLRTLINIIHRNKKLRLLQFKMPYPMEPKINTAVNEALIQSPSVLCCLTDYNYKPDDSVIQTLANNSIAFLRKNPNALTSTPFPLTISEKTAPEFAEMITSNTSITSIDLTSVTIDRRAFNILLPALMQKHIVSLTFSKIPTEKILIEALEDNYHLTTLKLSDPYYKKRIEKLINRNRYFDRLEQPSTATISLQNINLSKRAMVKLLNRHTLLNAVKNLIFQDCDISEGAIQHLVEKLDAMQSLSHIDFTNTPLSSFSTLRLAKWHHTLTTKPTITGCDDECLFHDIQDDELKLPSIFFNEEHLPHFKEWLLSGSTVKMIAVQYTGYQLIHVENFIEALKLLPNIETIDLQRVEFKNKDALSKAIKLILTYAPKLRKLLINKERHHYNENDFKEETIAHQNLIECDLDIDIIRIVTNRNKAIKPLEETTPIVGFTIAPALITDPLSFGRLLAGLQKHPELENLTLEINGLSDEILLMIGMAIKDMDFLLSLSLVAGPAAPQDRSQYPPAIYSDSSLNYGSFFKTLINHHPKLSFLSLANINLNDQAIKPLVNLIQASKWLYYLDVSYNQIENEGLDLLSSMLSENTSIGIFRCNGNKYTSRAAQNLAQQLMKNNTLTSLNLEHSTLEETHLSYFIEMLLANCSITRCAITPIAQKWTHDRFGTRPYKGQNPKKIESSLVKHQTKSNQLFNFIVNQQFNEFKKQVGKSRNKNARDDSGNSLLHIAVKKGYKKFIIYLLQAEINPFLINRQGQTVLMLAKKAETVDTELVEMLTQYQQGTWVAPKKSKTPSPFFQREKRPSPVLDRKSKKIKPSAGTLDAFFVKRPRQEEQIEPSSDISTPESLTFKRLCARAANDRLDEKTLHPNLFSQLDEFGRTLLHCAAYNTAPNSVSACLAKQLNANARDLKGNTPLHLACTSIITSKNQLDTCCALIPLTNVNQKNHDELTPLYLIAGGFSPRAYSDETTRRLRGMICAELLAHGADPNIETFDEELEIAQMNALHKAIIRGEYQVVKAILKSKKIDINKRNGQGDTPLHLAVKHQQNEILARLLIETTLEIKEKDNNGLTALQWVSQQCDAFEPSEENLSTRARFSDALTLLRDRANTQLLSPHEHSLWSHHPTLLFGCRFPKRDLIEINIQDEMTYLASKAPTGPGNTCLTTLYLVISTPEKTRKLIRLRIEMGDRVHIMDSVRSFESIEGRRRSPEIRDAILERFDAAPKEITEYCVDEPSFDTPLSAKGIHDLYSTDPNAKSPNFERLFHHSEQALFKDLEQQEKVDQLIQDLAQQKEMTPGSKVHAAIMVIYSNREMCPNCLLSAHGFQHPEKSRFLRLLTTSLNKRGYRVPKNGQLPCPIFTGSHSSSRLSAGRSRENHRSFQLDLRAMPQTLVIQDNLSLSQDKGPTRFGSRK